MSRLSPLADIQDIRADREVPCARLIGAAGTGKTYTLRKLIEADPTYGLLTATTGIAAVNLGAVTINSALKYYDTDSLKDAFTSGTLRNTLHPIAVAVRWIIIDESSMTDAKQLDIWYRGVEEVNRFKDVEHPLGILLVGDLAQLPPVKADWCFRARHWPKFAEHTERLHHVWRQDGGLFLDGLNLARLGKGGDAADLLTEAGVEWHTQVDSEFDGTTILSKNDAVARYNMLALDRIKAPSIEVSSDRWGVQRREWGENARTREWGIPPRAEYKIGAYVMLLSNSFQSGYANGDCGHIMDYSDNSFDVQLVRTGNVVNIPKLVRSVDSRDTPDDWQGDAPRIHGLDDDGSYIPRQHFRVTKRRYVSGQIEYFPMRLAYASTVHKSQSLTLDRVQVDFRNSFFGSPAMCYTALSRCRTLQGLRLVGQKHTFVERVKMDVRVLPWL